MPKLNYVYNPVQFYTANIILVGDKTSRGKKGTKSDTIIKDASVK